VTLDKTTLEFTIGDAAQTLTATVLPDKATNKKVTWTSDKPEVATVDAAGKVTAKGVGAATITVTTEDEGKTATCMVTVKAKPTPTPSPTPTPKPNPTPTPKPKPDAVEDATLATVLVAPNPFSTQLRIVNPEGASVTYELVNLEGLVLRAGVLESTETMIDTEDLVVGLYFVRLTGENGAQRGVRVVKH
ncbi:MAG: Ig-like domain-containing protein, partial [Bacteroides sp.]